MTSIQIFPAVRCHRHQGLWILHKPTEANKTKVIPKKKHEAFTITLNYSLPLKFCELLFDNSPLKWHFFFKSPWCTSTYQFRFNCERTKGKPFRSHFYIRAGISDEPERMKRTCLVRQFTNKSLMGIIFPVNNCSQNHHLLQITALGGFHTFRQNKAKAVTGTSLGRSRLTRSDSSDWVIWYLLICIFDANVVFVYGNDCL